MRITFLFLMMAWPFLLVSQQRITREEYIKDYKDIAIREMRAYGIPASIKMAQALLESDNGNSPLARQANNHFGIKCHKEWNGKRYIQDDDKRNECFRKYKHAEASYRDHSIFLTERPRYRDLFNLDIRDYRGWAHGLSKAGYATNPAYPALLIRIIEENRLQELDAQGLSVKASPDTVIQGGSDFPVIQLGQAHEPGLLNKVKYVLARPGDTYESIGREIGVAGWLLRKFNETPGSRQPQAGDIVFLQPKKRKAAIDEHIASGSETLWDISMRYGVKVKRLTRLNEMRGDEVPPAQARIRMR